MKKSSLLTQLAMAGIVAGLASITPARAADAATPDSATAAKKKHKKHKKVVIDYSAVKIDTSAKTGVAVVNEKHSCKGLNSCKGLGNCSTSQSELEARAKKMGITMDKAGSAHSCKGRNECKGLGGCAST